VAVWSWKLLTREAKPEDETKQKNPSLGAPRIHLPQWKTKNRENSTVKGGDNGHPSIPMRVFQLSPQVRNAAATNIIALFIYNA